MRNVAILSVGILLFASAVFGQVGIIGLYSDLAYTVCHTLDYGPALVPVYVVHKPQPGATASQFMVVPGGGFNCTYTGEIINVPVSNGSTQTGLSASYGRCVSAPILIVTINYFCTGTSPPCASLEVVPDPAAPTGTIEFIDCSFAKLVGKGWIMFFNPDSGCNCYIVGPTRFTTWGNVKALFP